MTPLTEIADPAHRHLFVAHRHADWPCHPRPGRWHLHLWWKHTHRLYETLPCPDCRPAQDSGCQQLHTAVPVRPHIVSGWGR